MGQAQQKRRTVLIVEDDAELRSLTAALFEDEQVDIIECESAEAALATMLIGGREVAMIFADVRLCGVMDGIDLTREVKMRWPLLPVILTSGYPCGSSFPRSGCRGGSAFPRHSVTAGRPVQSGCPCRHPAGGRFVGVEAPPRTSEIPRPPMPVGTPSPEIK
jgi:Response regulator receiver domain